MSAQTLVASIQMISTENVSQNLLDAEQLIRQAVEEGAKLIVLPENFALMGIDQADKILHSEEINHGPIQDFLSTQASIHGVWIIGGTIPIAVPGDPKRVYASCLVFDDQGHRVGRYDKIHLFDVYLRDAKENYSESNLVIPGNEIVVLETPFGKLGIAVCYDLRFPEMFRRMQKHGVEIVVLPAAFTFATGSAHWDVLVRARAIENLVYVITACQTGIHTNKRKTYGHSMIINPWGEVQSCLPDNSGVVISEINLDFLHEIRKDFPALEHRKL